MVKRVLDVAGQLTKEQLFARRPVGKVFERYFGGSSAVELAVPVCKGRREQVGHCLSSEHREAGGEWWHCHPFELAAKLQDRCPARGWKYLKDGPERAALARAREQVLISSRRSKRRAAKRKVKGRGIASAGGEHGLDRWLVNKRDGKRLGRKTQRWKGRRRRKEEKERRPGVRAGSVGTELGR